MVYFFFFWWILFCCFCFALLDLFCLFYGVCLFYSVIILGGKIILKLSFAFVKSMPHKQFILTQHLRSVFTFWKYVIRVAAAYKFLLWSNKGKYQMVFCPNSVVTSKLVVLLLLCSNVVMQLMTIQIPAVLSFSEVPINGAKSH